MSKPAFLFLMVAAPALAICLSLLGWETVRENILGWVLLAAGVGYPAGAAIYYFIRREPFWQHTRAQVVREEKGDRSFWIILPGFILAFFAPPIEWLYLQPILPRSLCLQIAGLVLVLGGMIMRLWTRSHIRGLYSGHVEVSSDAHLIKTGPYHVIRHPGYLGFVLITLGIAIGYSSIIALAGILVFLLPGLAYRIQVEESLLRAQFGEEYNRYIKETGKRLIPGVW
jgi:protein-S-isoprenylcysteine O-methyltransferase Ste14